MDTSITAVSKPPSVEAALAYNTKANCASLRKVDDIEPIWTLRAQDLTSDVVVQAWIDLNVDRLGVDHPKIRHAIATRDAMLAWPTRKLAGVKA